MIFQNGTWKTNLEVDDRGDSAIIHHVEDTTAIAEMAKFVRENTDRGFSLDRQYQCLGYMPLSVFHGEGFATRPIEDMIKWLESEAATPYRVTRGNTGKDARIRVK